MTDAPARKPAQVALDVDDLFMLIGLLHAISVDHPIEEIRELARSLKEKLLAQS